MNNPSSNSATDSPERLSYGIRPYRMPDAVWYEIAGYLPADARDRAPLLRDWIEGAGSPGLTGDTELHLHLVRAIIVAVQQNAARMDENLHLFLKAQAVVLQHLAEDAATIAGKLPSMQEAITRLETANAESAVDREELLRQLKSERDDHAETMRTLLSSITTSHNDLYQNRISPLLSAMLSVPTRMEALESSYKQLRTMVLGISCGAGILAVVTVIVARFLF